MCRRVEQLQAELTHLKRHCAQHQRSLAAYEEQLRRVARLQRTLHAGVPEIRDASVHLIDRPADVVSGDMYSVTRLDSSRVGMLVGDVTGHGLPAGMLGAFILPSLRGVEGAGSVRHALSPGQVLSRANGALLQAQLDDGQFVTAAYATYDERSRVFRWARAGGPYPILLRAGRPARPLVTSGPLLGVIEGARFEEAEVQLEPGDAVVLHTDGLEAFLAEGRPGVAMDQAGVLRLLAGGSTADVLSRIERRSSSARGWHEDDVTVLTLEIDARPTCLGLAPTFVPFDQRLRAVV